MQQWRAENAAMSFDEVSMERSKSFVKALQELKNLRPQLYSAAEYCEKSYLHSEQKQMVLDNLKSYAVRALVNAVDHLGTVAYKLTDLLEQQTSDVSAVELNISCLNQQILMCQSYTDKEGLRQQQILATTPRHHKHYILPNDINKRPDSSLQQQPNVENHIPAKLHQHPSGPPATKTLSWLMALDTDSASNEAPSATIGTGDTKASKMTSEVFNLKDAQEVAAPLPLSTHLQSAIRHPSSNIIPHMFGLADLTEVSKPLSAFRSFDHHRPEIRRPPVRSKSMIAIFFPKNKSIKQKKAYVA